MRKTNKKQDFSLDDIKKALGPAEGMGFSATPMKTPSLNWIVEKPPQITIEETPIKAMTTCGVAALSKVLSLYQLEVSKEQIEEFVRDDPLREMGVSFADLARFALTKGLSATLYGYNHYYTNPKRDRKQSSDYIKLTLKTVLNQPYLDEAYKPEIRLLIRAMDEGVRYYVERPTYQLIREQIDKGCFIILSVNSSALYAEQTTPYNINIGHAVVVLKCTKEKVEIYDHRYQQVQIFTPEELMFAVYNRRPIDLSYYMLVLEKKS